MCKNFEPGQSVRHITKNLVGKVVSKDAPERENWAIIAPGSTYTVQWDGADMPEGKVYPEELEAAG